MNQNKSIKTNEELNQPDLTPIDFDTYAKANNLKFGKDYDEDSFFQFNSIDDIIKSKREIEIINVCDFEVVTQENGKFKLKGNQHANLADIESEEFETLEEILYRLESPYLHDYQIVSRGPSIPVLNNWLLSWYEI